MFCAAASALARHVFQATMLLFLISLAAGAAAANTPCSGSKGGVSHCAAGKFVCNDGSISASKRVCDMPGGASGKLMSKPRESGASCPCRDGKFCTGPRGGTFCYSDSGNKSYIKR